MVNGPYIIELFFVISFRKPVADPLATLRDHLVSKKTIHKRQVIPQSLHLIGNYSNDSLINRPLYSCMLSYLRIL